MRCVKCEGKLVMVRVDDVDVDQCDRCGGIWFDAHELERVLRRKRGHLTALIKHGTPRPGDDDRRGHCPRCGGDGYLVQLASPTSRIHIDTCAICGGKWLDGGELDVLGRTTARSMLRRVLDWVLDFDL
ncbi:MAG: zf-TFIIB domain-containing protein [Minicystis sp.]